MLADLVNGLPEGEPVVVAGDFNDWRQKASQPLKTQAGLDEIFYPRPGPPGTLVPGESAAAAPRSHLY